MIQILRNFLGLHLIIWGFRVMSKDGFERFRKVAMENAAS